MKIFGLLICFVFIVLCSKPAEGYYWFCRFFSASQMVKVRLSINLHILLKQGLPSNISNSLRNSIGALGDENQYNQIVEQFDPRGAPIKVDNVTRINTPIQVSSIETLEDTAENEAKLKQSKPDLDESITDLLMVATDKGTTPMILEDDDFLSKYPAIIVNEYDGNTLTDSYISINKDILSQDEVESLSSQVGGFSNKHRTMISKSMLGIPAQFEIQITVIFTLYLTICKARPRPRPTLTPYPSPTPRPHPSPTPRPHPSPTPRPHPSPTPRPHPSSTPRPHPSSTPGPHPSSTPGPHPSSTPGPHPSPTPRPHPSSTPGPHPSSTPGPMSTACVTSTELCQAIPPEGPNNRTTVIIALAITAGVLGAIAIAGLIWYAVSHLRNPVTAPLLPYEGGAAAGQAGRDFDVDVKG